MNKKSEQISGKLSSVYILKLNYYLGLFPNFFKFKFNSLKKNSSIFHVCVSRQHCSMQWLFIQATLLHVLAMYEGNTVPYCGFYPEIMLYTVLCIQATLPLAVLCIQAILHHTVVLYPGHTVPHLGCVSRQNWNMQYCVPRQHCSILWLCIQKTLVHALAVYPGHTAP